MKAVLRCYRSVLDELLSLSKLYVFKITKRLLDCVRKEMQSCQQMLGNRTQLMLSSALAESGVATRAQYRSSLAICRL